MMQTFFRRLVVTAMSVVGVGIIIFFALKSEDAILKIILVLAGSFFVIMLIKNYLFKV
ncbi:MAG TPA: hypothetical protein PKK07_01610 [bacterium]|jgi:hypothetical protein|nr:hypothetical protein [bacterium]HOA18772.1 hypothetical protein [bacterium]